MLKEKKKERIRGDSQSRFFTFALYSRRSPAAAKWLLQLNVGKRPNQQMYHDMYLKS